jgi:1,5-anhydro-D-fructose reductase (1,5-anhydro-D-mannitol-forming)
MTGAVQLGLVGCGWAASEIVRAAAGLPALRIVAAFDADRSRAEALAQKTGATAAASIDALLADSAIDTLYVGLPHALLAPTVERALMAGKHVLAEKPLALDVATARRLGALAEERHLELAVFFELRRAGTVERARELVRQGAIGAPRFVRLRTLISKRDGYYGPPGIPNWRASLAQAGGGVLLMNTIHQLDTLRYVTGLDYVAATGAIATFTAPAEVEDTVSATLTLSNGGLLSLAANAHSPGADDEETIEIDGTLGRLNIPDPFGAAPLRLYSIADKTWRDHPVERPDSHMLMLESFVRAILNDGPVPAGASDAAASLAAVLAIYRAAAEKRTVAI